MKSKSFLTLAALLAAKPVRVQLQYGINNNVRLTAISNEERLKDGERQERNTFLTFTQYNEDGTKEIARSEFSYYDIEPTRENNTKSLATQLGQLINIAQQYVPDAQIDPFEGIEDVEELEALLKNPKSCKKLINGLYDEFETLVKDHIGPTSTLLRMKVMVNSNNYPQLSSDAIIVESMTVPETESALSMNNYERRVRQEALTKAVAPKTADAVPGAPAKDLMNNI